MPSLLIVRLHLAKHITSDEFINYMKETPNCASRMSFNYPTDAPALGMCVSRVGVSSAVIIT